MSRQFRILSLNVRQWTRDTDCKSPYYWKKRMSAMKKMIEDKNPDIICFQEMMVPAESYIPDGYKRVGLTVSHPIYIRKAYKASKHKFNVHQECAIITSAERSVQIINVHSHWDDDILEKNLRNIEKMLDLNQKNVICGDFNNDLEKIKRFGGIKYTKSARELLGIGEDEYTFENFDNPDHKFVIDHFFVRNLIPQNYELIKDGYGAERISDHYPILLDY